MRRTRDIDIETLCEDVPIGRLGRTTYLSLDIQLAHRDTEDWGGVVWWNPEPGACIAYRGPFRELGVQHRVRRYLRRRAPSEYLDGVPISRWRQHPGWHPEPWVSIADLLRLERLYGEFHRHFRVATDDDGTPQPGVNEISFMSTAAEILIRNLAARMATGFPRKGDRSEQHG